MKKSEDKIRLLHILDSAQDAIDFLADASFDEFIQNKQLCNSVVRSLEIIGEAAVHVSEETKKKNSEIEWAVMIGMRNRLIHAYFDINYKIVWQTVKKNLPPFIENLKSILTDFK